MRKKEKWKEVLWVLDWDKRFISQRVQKAEQAPNAARETDHPALVLCNLDVLSSLPKATVFQLCREGLRNSMGMYCCDNTTQ